MKVSVVIPMYNAASFIERTLKCVLAQTFQDFEVIVVNDGSTDGSAGIVRAVGDSRIRVIDKSNTGVSDTRNVGIRAARGEYIASLDSDDYWYPDHLGEAMAFFAENPEVVWYGARQYSLPYGTEPPRRSKHKRDFGRRIFFVDGKRYIDSTNLIFKREVFEECGEYPVGVAYFEDWIFQGQIAAKYPIVGTNECVTSIYFRGRPGSATMIDTKDRKEDYRRVLHSLEQGVNRNHVKSPTWVLSISRLFFRTMLFKHNRDEVLSAVKEFRKLNGPKRTARWCRFIKCSYALANEKMHDYLVLMTSVSFKERLSLMTSVLQNCGTSCCLKWLAIVLMYAHRGVMDTIQDRLERQWMKN